MSTMKFFQRSSGLIATFPAVLVLVVYGCSGYVAPEDAPRGLHGERVDEAQQAYKVDSGATCTATAWCQNELTVSCDGNVACYPMDFDGDPNGVGWVECDGVKTYCSGGGSSSASSGGGTSCPGIPPIHEYLHPCYPSVHPHGRYGLLNADSSATYTWSGNVTFMSGTTGTYVIVKPKSVGGYTLTVTATKPGCSTVKGSASFFAASCSGA